MRLTWGQSPGFSALFVPSRLSGGEPDNRDGTCFEMSECLASLTEAMQDPASASYAAKGGDGSCCPHSRVSAVVLGNAASLLVFRVGAEDADLFSRKLEPLRTDVLKDLAPYQAWGRIDVRQHHIDLLPERETNAGRPFRGHGSNGAICAYSAFAIVRNQMVSGHAMRGSSTTVSCQQETFAVPEQPLHCGTSRCRRRSRPQHQKRIFFRCTHQFGSMCGIRSSECSNDEQP